MASGTNEAPLPLGGALSRLRRRADGGEASQGYLAFTEADLDIVVTRVVAVAVDLSGCRAGRASAGPGHALQTLWAADLPAVAHPLCGAATTFGSTRTLAALAVAHACLGGQHRAPRRGTTAAV